MKGAVARGNDGMYLAGKGFLLVMVVFFSALSFTLGFLVGKQGERKKGDYQAASSVVSGSQGTATQNVLAQGIQQAKTVAPPINEGAQAQPHRENGQIAVPGQPAAAPVAATEGARPEVPDVQTKTVEKAPSKESVKEKTPAETKTSREDDVVYEVQLGALKNAAEAKRLKEKYARKGYKTSITVARTKNKEKVYKVKAGEFRDRKDAELLSLKLKKNEGLHAFVTLRKA